MQIRNSSHLGDSIHNFTHPLLTITDWVNISFSEEIILTPGDYYLWMEKIPLPSYSAWEKSLSPENNTNTWVFDGVDWNQAAFDLTLKVNTKELISPEDVDMKVNNITVYNTALGKGSVKITGNIISSNTTLNVTSNESISFFFSLDCIFNRNHSLQYDTQIQQYSIDWNLTIDSGYFGDPYFDYIINVSGFKDDYYNIDVFNQTDGGIGYSLIPSSEVIRFESEATHIIFKSQNYVESVTINDNLQIGTNITINVSANGIGDIYAFIWDDETLVYQNSSYNVSNRNFQWYLDPLLDLNSLTVEIFYNGSNQIGYYSEVVQISKISEIISNPIHGYALDNFTFSCQFRDQYSQESISDGIVSYNFGDLSGVLELDQNGNYSDSIDLSQIAILPGEYSINVTAEKENYGTVYSKIPIIINSRNVTLVVSKSRITIAPGKTINFEINLKDINNEPHLLRPVDIEISVFHSGSHSNGALVDIETIEGISSNDTFEWKSPSDIEDGSYDIVIEIISDYYTGILNLDQAIEVKSSIFWIIILPVFIGLVSSLVSGYFIQKERIKKSILGLMILHDNGIPLAEKISYKMQKSDSTLVSGAFIGILSLIKEITGSRLRTIEIEGGFVNLIHGKSFWLIVFIKNNPRWIEKGILNLKDEIQLEYGEKIIDFHGKPLDIAMDEIIKKYFDTKILTEPPVKEESLLKISKNNKLKKE